MSIVKQETTIRKVTNNMKKLDADWVVTIAAIVSITLLCLVAIIASAIVTIATK